MTTLRTDRLILRPWRDDDLEPFAALNADPEVMRFFPSVLTRERSDAMAERLGDQVDERGWGLWAVEVQDGAPFIGFIGLQPIPFESAFHAGARGRLAPRPQALGTRLRTRGRPRGRRLRLPTISKRSSSSR